MKERGEQELKQGAGNHMHSQSVPPPALYEGQRGKPAAAHSFPKSVNYRAVVLWRRSRPPNNKLVPPRHARRGQRHVLRVGQAAAAKGGHQGEPTR